MAKVTGRTVESLSFLGVRASLCHYVYQQAKIYVVFVVLFEIDYSLTAYQSNEYVKIVPLVMSACYSLFLNDNIF